ncbi:tetratricopeptide repeat protein [Neolewinella maritima]|nr:tetratricopeptide repeat protein [Neolewinella maritima]
MLLIGVLLAAAGYGQMIFDVTQTVYFVPRSDRTDYYVSMQLPLIDARQGVEVMEVSPLPTTVAEDGSLYVWDKPMADSIHLTYRIAATPLPEWGSAAVASDTMGERTAAAASTAAYPLPRLVREDVARTALGKAGQRDEATTIYHLLKVLRRVKAVRHPERFDHTQPLLEDTYRRQTTARRKHQLLSLGLQYHGIPHRLVAGKNLRFGVVAENQLWLELFTDGRWSRIDLAEPNEYLRQESTYLPCTYDWQAYTFTLLGPPELDWRGEYEQTLLKLWADQARAVSEGAYPLALSYLDTMLQFAPKMLTVVAEKGLVMTQSGDPIEGVKYLQYALQQAKSREDKAMAFEALAKYYALTNQPEQAVEAIARSHSYSTFKMYMVYEDMRFASLLDNKKVMRKLNGLYY